MDKKTLVEKLNAALWHVFHEDPALAGELALVRERHPILAKFTDEQIVDFHEEIMDNVGTQILSAAREYAESMVSAFEDPVEGRICRCLNPRCEFKTVTEAALLCHYPDPGLLVTLSPGDTIPLGLCPECKGPVYQPEEFPEDEVDAPAQSVVDPQHRDVREPPVEGCGCHYCIAKRGMQMGLEPQVVKALTGKAPTVPTRDTSTADNTGSPAPGATDCSGDFTPEYQ